MTAVSPRSGETQGSLPKEFSHPSLQELVLKGRTTGSITSDQLQAAFSEAKISPTRGRVVLRALGDQGIEVQVPESTPAKKTAKKAPAKKAAAKKTAAKKAAKAQKRTASNRQAEATTTPEAAAEELA